MSDVLITSSLGSFFDEETVKAQKFAAKQDWENLMKFFEENKERLLWSFDNFGNTVFHVVARSDNEELFEKLLEMLPESEQSVTLRMHNREGNTLLHEAVLCKRTDTVDVIMKFGEKFLENGSRQLLEIKNGRQETPVFRAAKQGNLKILKHLHDRYTLRHEYFSPSVDDGRQLPILHNCLLMFNPGIAIWLVKEVSQSLTRQTHGIENTTFDSNGKKMTNEIVQARVTCFQLLSKMPMAFRSTATQEMGISERLVYHMLPDKGYLEELELSDAEDETLNKDIESGHPDDEKKIEKKSPNSKIIKFFSIFIHFIRNPLAKVFAKLYFSVWNRLQPKDSPRVDDIWDQKKNHIFAEKLAMLLVKDKDFWYYHHSTKGHKNLNRVPYFSSNVTDKKNEIELKHRIQREEEIRRKINTPISREKEHYEAIEETARDPPILLAAASGIIEVVKIIYDDYPAAIFDLNNDGLNVLHLAIRHRRSEIYKFIKKCAAFPELATQMCNNGGTILHEVGSMDYYREPAGLDVASQLNYELRWYHHVKAVLPKNYIMHCDRSGLTAEDLFKIEHAEMHENAKIWMKETAQSCSTVAVLIAGAVFAAAYGNTPGGTDNGKHHESSTFHFYTSMDVYAFALSLLSVAIFLSIQTSSFDLWDFHNTLPKKLFQGFTLLFFSFIYSLSAFALTVSLSIGNERYGKFSTFLYSLVFLIIFVFGSTQFGLHKRILEAVLFAVLKDRKRSRWIWSD